LKKYSENNSRKHISLGIIPWKKKKIKERGSYLKDLFKIFMSIKEEEWPQFMKDFENNYISDVQKWFIKKGYSL